MSGETLVKGVFSNYLTGFQDMSPAIREETAKASILFAKHLGEKAINGDLIRNVSRLGSSDPEPGIRANSLVCIGKLSNQLTEKAMQYIVTPVLLTALKDQFPPARVASLKVIIACSKKIDAVELVRKVIPMICQLLLDSEKSVREAARGTINVLLGIVDEYCKKLPDTTVPLANTNANKSTAGAAVAANGSSGGGAAKQDGLSAAIQNKLVETVTEGINWWGGSGSSHADVDTSIKADTDSNVIADTNTSTTENKDTSKNSTAGLKPMSLANKKPAINKTFEYNSYGDDAFGVQENKQGAQDLLGWNENLDFELDFEPIDKPIASPTFPVMTPQQKPQSSPMQSSHNTGNKGLGGSSILDKFILDQQKEEMEKKTRVHSQPPFQQTQQQQGPRSGSMGLGMGMGVGMGMGMGLGANANGTNSTNSPSTGPGFGFGSIGASSSTGGGSSSRKKKMGAIKLNK
ncbi:N-terminal kinase-like protein [Zancudomyces culisetae]|uniref:N-terminal kinase-like protein n=1 Tax=Zancudomyces culisetae TaxID=1213189 RepID=A0A1R1PUK5_ZANCU|nr:N-terminal kinase-like protein [Zancudomyces culisetae]|eukprot:OMH84660.1 N-terminal kinase-like protein [Zancudomyces culisetae]